MKKFIKFTAYFLVASFLCTPVAMAAEEIIVIGRGQQNLQSSRSLPTGRSSQESFEPKTEKEREKLSQSDQNLVDNIEKYLTENINPNTRNFGVVANKLIASLVFDVTVKRENTVIDAVELLGLMGNNAKSEWFESVADKSDRYLTVYDEPTASNIKLHAYYVDNHSDKTAVVQHGYRSNALNIMEEAEFLYNLGYNVIIPDARSHGQSEGTYISFGAYEKNDVNAWINQEIQTKPNQKIVLLGVSMGAATVMMSQETPHKNVQAIIEDCGYYSIEQQARDVTRLITSKLQYIPLVNSIDWYNCESAIIKSLNENYVKPILKIDMATISPLNAVSQSNVPKLFIHGTDDWFIPPVAMSYLYDSALGYKEKLSIEGAGHAVNLSVGGDKYKEKVISFLDVIEQMKSLRATLAETKNLLLNTEFKRNQKETSFEHWKLSSDGKRFNTSTVSNPYEFVLKRSGKEIVSAISVDNKGLKFYKKWAKSAGYVGQDVPLIKGQNYELSFDAWNPNPTEYSGQVIHYGFGEAMKREKQTAKNKVNKKMNYSPSNSELQTIKLGSEMTYYNIFGRTNTAMYLSNVKLINTDVTAPEKVSINNIEITNNDTTISGRGEKDSKILIKTSDGEAILEVMTEENGNFVITIPQQEAGKILHLVNQDVKGNTSESIVLVSN